MDLAEVIGFVVASQSEESAFVVVLNSIEIARLTSRVFGSKRLGVRFGRDG